MYVKHIHSIPRRLLGESTGATAQSHRGGRMYVKHIHSIPRRLLGESTGATAQSHRGGRNTDILFRSVFGEKVPVLPRSHIGEAECT